MYKKLLCLFLCLSLFGCGKDLNNEQVDTIIEEHENIIIAINTPTTGIKKLDKVVSKYTQDKYKNFVKNYQNVKILNQKSELNIDYTYSLVNERYISIAIYEFVNSSSLAHPINSIKTFIYDKKSKDFLSIKDIVKDDEKLLTTIKDYLYKEYKDCLLNNKIKLSDLKYFVLNDQSITFFFNPATIASSSCGIITITIPTSELPLSIKIEENNKKNELPTYNEKTKTIDPNKPVVALTFDDGPSKYTKKIVDFLKENDASATFFILGNKVAIYEQTLITMIENGNEIGNHSYSHKWLTKLSEVELKNQIEKVQTITKERLNYTPKYLRPTYGGINKKLRSNTDLEIVLWNVDTMDWKIKNSDKIASRAISKVKNGDIILMHDTYERTFEAVKKIVPELKKQGYQFVTVSELKEYQLLNKNLESDYE